MFGRMLLGLVKSMLAIATAVVPASVPAVAAVTVLGSTAVVTAGCGGGGEEGDLNEDGDDQDGDQNRDRYENENEGD